MKTSRHSIPFLFLLSIFLFPSLPAVSSPLPASHYQLPAIGYPLPDTILKKAAARFDHNVAFTITATILDGQKKQLAHQSADILYNKGKYRLSMPDIELISDGVTVWQWNKQHREVTINNVPADQIDPLNPGQLLANYQQNFKAKYIRTEDDGTAIIDLSPRSARSYHKIRLFINEANGLVRRLEVHKYDSGREIYDITGFKRASTPQASFSFNPAQHTDVEIIDMR